MAVQSQLNTALQPYRDVHIKIEVLDFDYYILDEISGLATSANFSINADSDIRRSCNINMILRNEYGTNPLTSNIYWRAGNPFWFDKYLKIYIGITEMATNEIVWTNQGIYLINQPSIVFDATTNELHFEGVDLMAQLTGLRDGNLEGLDYVVEAGTKITSAIKGVLQQQGFNDYVIFTPPQDVTPYEIKISAGGTSYDLLTQLRDINPDWEMFFDVDGVFYFQAIKDNFTRDASVVPFVTNEILQVLDTDFTLDTSFSDVKNYVEVYGGAIETPYTIDRMYEGYTPLGMIADIVIKENTFNEGEVYDYSFTCGNLESQPALRRYPFNILMVTCDNGAGVTKQITLNNPMLYDNMSYAFRIRGGSNNEWTLEYLGYVQPFGLAWDNNTDSPFYVGENVETWNIETVYNQNDLCYYNNICYMSMHDNNVGNIPFNAGYGYWTNIFEAEKFTDAIYNKPEFERQVRIVLSGGEYDNIYSNDLAIQRAKYEVYLRSTRHDNIKLTIVPIYWLDVNQIIEYWLPNETEPSYWLVKEVSTDFSMSGTQTITAIRYYVGQ